MRIAQRDPNLVGTVASAYRSMNEAVRQEVAGFAGQVLDDSTASLFSITAPKRF